MTQPGLLPDDELLDRAHEWRLRALHGDRDARGAAHHLEAEVRRRFGVPTVISHLEAPKARRRPWWRFWTFK